MSATSSSSASAAVDQPSAGFTLCPHTCGCTTYRSKGVQGRLSFRNIVNHLRGHKSHPMCDSTCQAFMGDDESLSYLDSEFGDGAAQSRKRKSVKTHVEDRPFTPDADPAGIAAATAAAAAAGPVYMTSSEFQAAVLEAARVNAQLQQMRVRFNEAQRDAIARRDTDIRFNFGSEPQEAAAAAFEDERTQP